MGRDIRRILSVAKRRLDVAARVLLRGYPPPAGSSRAQKGQFSEFFTHVKTLGFRPRTVIDVGVALGTVELYAPFPDAKFVLVEPLEEFRPHLEAIASRYDATCHLAAAGPTNGEVRIRVFGRQSSSSVLPVTEDTGSAKDARFRTVPMITLDSISDSLEAPIVLKLDVQGAELLALDGAAQTLSKTEIVLMETNLFQFHPGMPQFGEVVDYMSKRGFVVYDILGGLLRPRDNALGQVDLVFVKEDGFFRQSHGWD